MGAVRPPLDARRVGTIGDAGEPEGLAYKIEVFEAVDRDRGFDVRTPRIPGLQYRELEEI